MTYSSFRSGIKVFYKYFTKLVIRLLAAACAIILYIVDKLYFTPQIITV